MTEDTARPASAGAAPPLPPPLAEGVAGAFGLEGCGEAEGDDSAGTAESGFGEGVDCSGTEVSVEGMIASELVFSSGGMVTVCGGGVTTEAIS